MTARFPTAAFRSPGACAGVIALLAVTGCASAGTHPAPYQVETRTAAPPPLSPPSAGPVPAVHADAGGPPSLTPSQPALVGMPSTRVSVKAEGEDVASVIARVARQVGLNPVIDPSVHGPITANMQNVSIGDAMLRLASSRYQYTVQNGALVVGPIQLVQRTYTVDYLQMARTSTASTVVARGSQGTTSNTGIVANGTGAGTGVSQTSGGLVASGSDVIQSSSNVDIWGELKIQLEGILFGDLKDSLGRATPVPQQQNSLGGSTGSSRCVSGTCLGISPLTSLINVTATPDKQEEVARYLGLYTAAIERQVLIHAQFVEVTLDRSNSYGIDWTAVLNTAKGSVSFTTDPNSTVSSNGNSTFNLGFGDLTLKAVINALQSVGDVNVVAKPTTNAMNQQKASFNVTRQEQFFSITRTPIIGTTGTVSFIETPSIQTATVGLILDVLPQISDRNVVLMAIRPSVTSLVSKEVVQGSSGGVQATLPVIDHRETDTMARVRSGETIMIGGLIQRQTTSDVHGIPILMNLPFIGRLFSHTTTTEHHSELVIFLTPEIVSGQPPSGR